MFEREPEQIVCTSRVPIHGEHGPCRFFRFLIQLLCQFHRSEVVVNFDIGRIEFNRTVVFVVCFIQPSFDGKQIAQTDMMLGALRLHT